jgi:hypothetical protein
MNQKRFFSGPRVEERNHDCVRVLRVFGRDRARMAAKWVSDAA